MCYIDKVCNIHQDHANTSMFSFFNLLSFFKYSEAKLAKELIYYCRLYDSEADAHYQYDSETHMVKSDQVQIFLGNLFDVVKNMKKAERLAHIDSFIQSSLDSREMNYDSSSHLLVPRLKTYAEFQIWSHHLAGQNPGKGILQYPLTERFVWLMGIDNITAVHTVMENDLDKLKMSRQEAFKHALANLYGKSDGPFIELRDGIYVSRFADDHDAARLLLIDEIKKLPLKGNPVAFVPTANDLLMCGDEDFDAFVLLAPQIQEIAQQKRLLSLHPLVLIDDQWQDFTPPKQTEYAPVYNLNTLEISTQYADQKQQIEARHQAQGIDIFIASQSAYEKDESPFYFTVCVWSEDVHTWLPEAEIVKFYGILEDDEADIIGALSWQETLEHFGDLMKPIGLTPERYELTSFPDKHTLLKVLNDSAG